MLKSTQIRSFLANNVDVMLENINAQRQRNKIDSDDLFGGGGNQDANIISWKPDTLELSDLQVLLSEKESLGIYVSGNPLQEYSRVQTWIRDNTFTDSIYLVIINKLRKIFTKSNNMMFAFDLSTLDESVEGIIFPKLAPHYSNILEEKELYWVRGKISQKKKKKQISEPIEEAEEQVTHISSESEIEPESASTIEIKEYDELPKLIIDAIARFEDGPLGLFDDTTSLSVNRIAMIETINWAHIKAHPGDFISSDQTTSTLEITESKSSKQNIQAQPQKVVLKKHLGPHKLKLIHQSITRENIPNSQEIELWVETNGELKKVKGPLWIDQQILNEIN